MTPKKTLCQKIWDSHVVHEQSGQPAIIYIDRHLIHEGTSPQAFAGLRADGLSRAKIAERLGVGEGAVSRMPKLAPDQRGRLSGGSQPFEPNRQTFRPLLFPGTIRTPPE